MSNATVAWRPGQFQELFAEECLGLLRSKRLGRVAYVDAGPVVLPVSYVVHDDTCG